MYRELFKKSINTLNMPEEKEIVTITVPEEQLRELLAQNERYKKNEAIIIEAVTNAMVLLGIWDEQKNFNPELAEKKNYFSVILRTLKKKISLGDLILGGKRAEKQIAENFGFLSTLKPIIDEYSHVGKQQ